MKELMIKALDQLNIELSEKQYNQIYRYYDLLMEWNKVMNLTGIANEEEFIQMHFLDSLLSAQHIDYTAFDSLIDIGTGAGFPGIPLKIVYPHLKVTLLDSLNKRINFLNEVIKELELDQVETIHGRAEDFGKNESYREVYDICVSRAVSQLPVLSEYCIPFVKVGGQFVSYKASDSDEEILDSHTAIEILGGHKPMIQEASLSALFTKPRSETIIRRFIVIEKIKETPVKYPRKSGIPVKRPLK